MKQITAALIKLIGFYFLVRILHFLFNSAYYLKIDQGMLLYFLALVVLNLIVFYLCVFKTKAILDLFKINWESVESISYCVILKTGVFLIGFYLCATSLVDVVYQIFSWIKMELSSVGANSVEFFSEMILNVYNPDSLVYSLCNVAIGFLIAYKHQKIALYFMNVEEK